MGMTKQQHSDPATPDQIDLIKKALTLLDVNFEDEWANVSRPEADMIILSLRDPRMQAKSLFQLTDGKTVLQERVLTGLEAIALNHKQLKYGDPFRWFVKGDEHAT